MLLALSLPLTVDIVSAATNTSTTKVTISQLNTAATSVNSFYKTNKRLPNYVTIASKQVTMPQFLYLIATATSQLNSGSTASIAIKNVNSPPKPSESLKKGNIQKAEYVTVAKNLKKFIDTNGRAPNFQETSRGKIKFENMVDTYSRILIFYKNNKRIPNYVEVTPWTGKNYTTPEGGSGTTPSTTDVVSVTPTQLNQAVASVKAYVESRNKMPTTVTVAGKTIGISQFLQLLAQRITDLNSGKNVTIKTKKINAAATPSETINAGNILKADFVSLAKTIAILSSGSKIPNYWTIAPGKIRYESTSLLFLKAISFYNTNNRLPNYIYTTRWTGTTSTGMTSPILRPVYIISDKISNNATDNARINAVIAELKKLGVTAYNYGVGANNIAILSNTNVPINALVVQFFGGACASTLNEMGTSYYKSLKDSKKVFTVFTDGAKKITGLAWLERAHDDNFSPESFTGLANPDQYLINNGYKYYEGYNSSKLSELVQILYKEATN
jgi:hypothetical protein